MTSGLRAYRYSASPWERRLSKVRTSDAVENLSLESSRKLTSIACVDGGLGLHMRELNNPPVQITVILKVWSMISHLHETDTHARRLDALASPSYLNLV
jgi:hypothetical protein